MRTYRKQIRCIGFRYALWTFPIWRPGRARVSSKVFRKANVVSCPARPFPTLAVKHFLTNSWPQVEAASACSRAWTTDARALPICDVELPPCQNRLRVQDGDAPGGCKKSGSKGIDRLLPRCRQNPERQDTLRPGSLILLGRHLPSDAALPSIDRYPWLIRWALVASETLSTLCGCFHARRMRTMGRPATQQMSCARRDGAKMAARSNR